jgi:FKBP-type peptidyl-prolyl cis-trans isomerase 2
MTCIDRDMVVAIRYIMRNDKGYVLEDIMKSSPVNYLHGSNGICFCCRNN